MIGARSWGRRAVVAGAEVPKELFAWLWFGKLFLKFDIELARNE
jgi:hypothetical protein